MFSSLGALAVSLSSSMEALFSAPLDEFRLEYGKTAKKLSAAFEAAAHDYELALDRFLSSKPHGTVRCGAARRPHATPRSAAPQKKKNGN